MSAPVRVLLPPHAAHLAPLVLEAGCTPVVDATGSQPPEVPDGAWVRTRPGRPAPGNGPVILAELGAPVADRPTWLETSAPRDVPQGFAGLVLKGRESSGLGSEEDGLLALSRCPDPARVMLDAGCGPRTAGAAAALGAAGVLLSDVLLGCPEFDLPPAMARRLSLADDEVTSVVGGFRVANPPTAPVLRKLRQTSEVWPLTEGLWSTGDLQEHLWLAGQGLVLARELADRHGGLVPLLRAYLAAMQAWPTAARKSQATDARPVGTVGELNAPGTAATTGGAVGSTVLWEEAGFLGRPVHGGPLRAAQLAYRLRRDLDAPVRLERSTEPMVPVVVVVGEPVTSPK